MSNCCCNNNTDNLELQLNEVIQKNKNKKGALISVLHQAQELYGYLPEHVQKKISEGLRVPMTEIYGVITFYSLFSLEPKGKYRFSVCMGTACYVRGAGEILERLKEKLGVDVGKATEDGLFSIEDCRCLGACGLAPIMMVNDKVYGRLSPKDIDGILEEYKNS